VSPAVAWAPASSAPTLPPGEVHVWRVDLDVPPPRLTALAAMLSAEERMRALRFRLERHRDRWVAARATLRAILAASRTPVIVSHTGPAELRPFARHLSEDLLRAVAARGGVIGVWPLTRGHPAPLDQFLADLRHVKGVVGKVALGQADAGFVYLTDIAPVATRVRAIAIPARAQPTVVYELAIAAKPNDLEAAQDVVIAVLGPDGRRQLRAARFGLP